MIVLETEEKTVTEEVAEEVTETEKDKEKERRYCGILCHPTSLPSPYGIGDLGKGAYDFVDFLERAGQKLWQVLPLGPTGYGDSPYQSYSVFAGQPLLISPQKLAEQKLLEESDLEELPEFDAKCVEYGKVQTWKNKIFAKAFENFQKSDDAKLKEEYDKFIREQDFWLSDYAFYMAVRKEKEYQCWTEWEAELKNPTPVVRTLWEGKLKEEIDLVKFEQFEFFKQWAELKAYANGKDIRIIGDMPIFVSIDSSDVWANKKLFSLDSKGYPLEVAGVPPDYFSVTGQLWGNPLYDWKEHELQGFEWWIARVKNQLTQVDYLRIDHFRGFESYWAVPAGEETAVNGEWKKGPCEKLFFAIEEELGKELPIFAEDLGIITPEVEKLRDRFEFPGMKVLQFGFEAWPHDGFYPHNFKTVNCICYTGTHDNDTTKGWYENAKEEARDRVRRYMNCDGGNVSWDFIRTAMSSIAKYAIYPLQDVLMLGSDARMNVPGVLGKNWAWRFEEGDLKDWQAEQLKLMSQLFNR
ncbi:MAG: 4-alpha-glucanotransferase [Lachnospiraceae bacterium]